MEPDLKKQGYDKEEAYFNKLNKVLLEKMKNKKKPDASEKDRPDNEKR